MTGRDQLLQTLDETHTGLITAAMDSTARGMKGPWGPREILAHVVGWEAVAIAYLPQLLEGNELLERAINIAMVTLVGDQSIETLSDMLYQVHQRFIQMPEVQDEVSFVPGHAAYERAKAAIAHSLEHVRELELWQEDKGR